jgi:ATP synthase subunit 6
MTYLSSPLEQFQILPLLPFHLGNIDFSFTNATVLGLIIILLLFTLLICALEVKTFSFFFIPNRWQSLFEILYKAIVSMVGENVGAKGQEFFPFVFSLFLFLVFSNLIGLIPYSYTLTSHLIVTLTLAMVVFLSVNILCAREHGWRMFSLFLPAGTSLGLAFLLVPIELISYIFKPVSLAIRLFANMMAGHTLLKVIAGFAWSLMGCSGILFLAHYIPLVVLVPLFGLELGVALIQAYVFTILTCIYLNDALNLH